MNSRQYVSWFNFKGSDQQKRVGDLSGGERNRVHLAKLLRSGGNLLLLDEPTNDLDVDTLRALEDALLDFAGCAAVISHDRDLDRVYSHPRLRGRLAGDVVRGQPRGSTKSGYARRGARRLDTAPDHVQATRPARGVDNRPWPLFRQAEETRQEGRAEVAEGEAQDKRAKKKYGGGLGSG